MAALDDFYLDFTGTSRLYPDFAATLRRVQQQVAGELALTVSVGAGSSKLIASIASRLKVSPKFCAAWSVCSIAIGSADRSFLPSGVL